MLFLRACYRNSLGLALGWVSWLDGGVLGLLKMQTANHPVISRRSFSHGNQFIRLDIEFSIARLLVFYRINQSTTVILYVARL